MGIPLNDRRAGSERLAGAVLVLGMMSAFGPMSIDMYLPSLPSIARDLAVPASSVQLTLSAFFIGFGVGQLIYGPASDRLGRRPVLVAGIVLYVITSAFCALSPNIEALILFRLLHALGGGAGTVIARAVIRDRFDTDTGARVMSFMALVTGLAPLLAPLIGGQVLVWFGWRAIFWILTGFGVVCLSLVLLALPESNPPERRQRGRLGSLFTSYLYVLGSRPTMGYILTGGFAFSGMFAFISGTPFVYIELFGVPAQQYGFYFGANIVGMMAVSLINGRLVMRFGARRMLAAGCAVMTLGGTAALLLALGRVGGLFGVVVPLFFYVSMLALVAANAISLAAEQFASRAGAVAALFGAGQFGLGAAAGLLVGLLHDGTAVPMTAVIAGCGAVSLLSLFTLTRAPSAPAADLR